MSIAIQNINRIVGARPALTIDPSQELDRTSRGSDAGFQRSLSAQTLEQPVAEPSVREQDATDDAASEPPSATQPEASEPTSSPAQSPGASEGPQPAQTAGVLADRAKNDQSAQLDFLTAQPVLARAMAKLRGAASPSADATSTPKAAGRDGPGPDPQAPQVRSDVGPARPGDATGPRQGTMAEPAPTSTMQPGANAERDGAPTQALSRAPADRTPVDAPAPAGSSLARGASMPMVGVVEAASRTEAKVAGSTPGSNATGAVGGGAGSVRARDAALQRLVDSARQPRQDVAQRQTVQSAVAGVAMALRPGGGDATITLTPNGLGTLRVQVRVADGQVAATLSPSTREGFEALRDAREGLRAALESKGLRVDSVSVVAPPAPPTLTTEARPSAGSSPGDGSSPQHASDQGGQSGHQPGHQPGHQSGEGGRDGSHRSAPTRWDAAPDTPERAPGMITTTDGVGEWIA